MAGRRVREEEGGLCGESESESGREGGGGRGGMEGGRGRETGIVRRTFPAQVTGGREGRPYPVTAQFTTREGGSVRLPY